MTSGRPVSGQYLYERLGAQHFQRLCSALLRNRFEGVTCFPVGQSDGGRDAVRRAEGRTIIYQVKWTHDRVRYPVGWLEAAVRGEADNIKRLVANGAGEYVLMTNLAGTSSPGRGSMDLLAERLEEHSRAFGIPVECWWQAEIDALVDAAPRELKWAYPEMLAGHDLVRFLIEADRLDSRDKELHTLLLKVIATQWQQDAKVKFKQVELDTHDLVDLFVDVEAERTAAPGAARSLRRVATNKLETLGGAANYLLRTSQPLTLVRGEPGQGKSTLGQFLAQVHRADYLKKDSYLGGKRPELRAVNPRLPIRVDLRDYAAWLDGQDPFAEIDTAQTVPRRRRHQGSLERFVAQLLEARSGGMPATVPMVADLLARFPILIVLDGLDEVAQEPARVRVVKEINEFTARLGASFTAPQVIVTTRPNASGFAEPSADTFETITLCPLSPSLRTAYLRKWADARSIRGSDRRALQRTFNDRSAEPHIAQLADNPMQLTILLYLLQKRGDSVPTGRTDLYRSYMETFLDREAAKSQAVHDHRKDLEEVTAFLGWHVQGIAEAQSTNGQMTAKAIRRVINDYLYSVEKDSSLVEDLFKGVTDRVWALTSKVEGTFEFDVQPVREYFAAKYLYEYAGDGIGDVQKSSILRELVRRPYWLNTSRFYAGFANPNEITGLVEGIEEEIEETRHPAQVRVAAWSLLSDGVFAARTRTQRRATRLFTDELSARVIHHTLTTSTAVASPPADQGAIPLQDELLAHVSASPTSPTAKAHLGIAMRLHLEEPGLGQWWLDRVGPALGGPGELAWLSLAEPMQAGRLLDQNQMSQLALAEPTSLAAALDAGVTPPVGSELERRLARGVLDGLCSDTRADGFGLPSDLIAVLAPQHFLRMARRRGNRVYVVEAGHRDTILADQQRQARFRRLKERDPGFARVQAAMTAGRRVVDSAAPWGDAARALSELLGPCWLAADLAVIGAATDPVFRADGAADPRREPFGAEPDYGRLLQDTRVNREKVSWWRRQFEAHGDTLSRATWAYALVAVARNDVVAECFDLLCTAASTLEAGSLAALIASSSRLGASGVSRRLPADLVKRAGPISLVAALLIAHHTDHLSANPDLDMSLSAEQLAAMAQFGMAGWPASRIATDRMTLQPSAVMLAVLKAHGAQTVVEIKEHNTKMPPDLMRTIIDDAGSYPLGWVLEAERVVSLEHSEPFLAKVAEEQGWFAG